MHDRASLRCRIEGNVLISSNKLSDVRAVLCHDADSVERDRKFNNAQVVGIGAQVVGPGLVKPTAEARLKSEFQNGIPAPKLRR